MNPLRYFQLGVLAVLLAAGVTGVLSYRHLAAKAAIADRRIAEAETAAEVADGRALKAQQDLDTLSKEVIRRNEFDAAIAAARARTSRNLDTASREDPASAGFLQQPIPQRVRDAFAQERSAEAKR